MGALNRISCDPEFYQRPDIGALDHRGLSIFLTFPPVFVYIPPGTRPLSLQHPRALNLIPNLQGSLDYAWVYNRYPQ